MPTLVPNEFPTLNLDYKLAIIGESPGEQEEVMRQPFVGTSGRMLQAVMQEHRLARSACFLGNICQFRPPKNDIKAFSWEGEEIRHGLKQLSIDIQSHQPNCILLLGATPLRAAGIVHSVSSFRGTIFRCVDTSSPFYGFKCVSSLHPAYILRQYSDLPLFSFDVGRAAQEATSPDLNLPTRQLDVELNASQIIDRLDAICEGSLCSVDIEGGIQQGITCVGIATSPDNAFIVNHNDFSDSERTRILRSLGRFLSNPRIPKVLQNSLYDNFCLMWNLKMPIRGVVHDTMLSGWEIFPELPKGLDTQASIWTREPYYKFQRKITDKLTHYKYCCTDAAVTYEIHTRHVDHLSGGTRAHYDFNIELLPAMLYMEHRGIRYDKEKAINRLAEVSVSMSELQGRIDRAAGQTLNVNSPKQMARVLYTDLGFEPQYKKEHGRKTTSLTADVEALLNLSRSYNEPIILDILNWRVLEGQRKQLELSSDADGRVRCSYNLVGTETGRLTCYESPTGSGTNLQTIMKSNRDLFVADPGYLMFQCDLSGADGWTVAAHCKRLGDPTMWDDYIYGLKPANLIALFYHDQSLCDLDRPSLKELARSVDKDGWLYFACKRVQHASNYMGGKNTMSSQIMKDSWKLSGKPVYVSPKDCEALQKLYFNLRYRGVYHWHHAVKTQLEKTRSLSCASGHIRTFFGRANDLETIKAALSHEPQANTTYATNLALHNLWHDPDNRDGDGKLIIQPLHQVHDALIGQFPEDKIDWAKEKIASYFNNPLTIAEQQITIPFEGGYGLNWKELPNKI